VKTPRVVCMSVTMTCFLSSADRALRLPLILGGGGGGQLKIKH
jgi:hypothetical protein